MTNNNYHLRPALQNKPLSLAHTFSPPRPLARNNTAHPVLSSDRSWWVSNVIPPSLQAHPRTTSLNTNLTMSVMYVADQSSQLPSFLVSADNAEKYFMRKRFSQLRAEWSHWRPHRLVSRPDWWKYVNNYLSVSVDLIANWRQDLMTSNNLVLCP